MFFKILNNLKKKISTIFIRPLNDPKGTYSCIYTKASHIYHFIAVLIVFFASVFAIVALLFNLSNITYDNFYYFIKDFDTIIATEEYSSFRVDYSYEDLRSYIGYKGGVATIGQSSLTIYSATGQKTGKFYHTYSSPEIKGGANYLIIYDQGGNDFSIYNSFARLYSEHLTYPISLIEMCDSGEFVVVTTNNEYRSVLYFYNSDFDCIGAYYYNEYVTSVALSSEGKYMLVSIANTDTGTLSTKMYLYYTDRIELYENGKLEAQVIPTDSNSIIIDCCIGVSGGVLSENNYCCLHLDSISVYDNSNNMRNYEFHSSLCSDFEFDSDGIAVILALKNKYNLHVESFGYGSVDITLESEPLALAKSDKYVFVLFANSIIRYDLKLGIYQEIYCTVGADDIVISSEDSVIICYPSYALGVDF